jgi:hypothetical protein
LRCNAVERRPINEGKFRGLNGLALFRERARRHQARIKRDNMKSDD